MKKILLLISLLLSSYIHKAQSYGSMGTYNTLGVPNYLVPTNDVIPSTLLATIAASLPENYPVPTYHPSYISNGTNTNIFMQSSGDVWVTFVDEGAGYKNVLGYYSYPSTSPPTSIPSNSNLKIIFPNVSKLNSGGGLVAGNKVFLGHFDAGTVISWFLIADGFRNNTVTNGNWRLFSNPSFNPEASASLKYHNVLLYDSVYKKIILGFEDIRRDYSSCDNDFNDAIFYVSATPDTAIYVAGMINTTNPSQGVSSGNNGGLESNGSLSELISKRNFINQNKAKHDSKENQLQINLNKQQKTRGLNMLLPNLSSVGLSSTISTPNDLIGLTNAKEIVSYDYYDSLEQRQAVVLLTETEGKVYNHTKSICDRLKNASLVSLEEKQISGIPFITYTMEQENGSLEYVTCFSISDDTAKYTLYNQWLIGQYPIKNHYLNYQVWSIYPHVNQYVIEKTIELIAQSKTLEVDSSEKVIPTIYFKKGINEDNVLHLQINNTQEDTNAIIILNYTNSEQDQRHEMQYPVDLKAHSLTSISIPFEGLFDADIHLVVNNTIIDEMYLADGAWGVEFPAESSTLNDFQIQQSNNLNQENTHLIQRGAKASISYSEYFTLYKMFKPSNMSSDLSEYDYLNFDIITKNNSWLRLHKKSISSWNEQPKFQLIGSDSVQHVSIPLNMFKTINGESISKEDLTSLSFTQVNNYQAQSQSEICVNNVAFSKKALNTIYLETTKLNMYPSPCQAGDMLTITFLKEQRNEITISLRTINGTPMYSNTMQANPGANKFSLQVPKSLEPGIYIVEVISNNHIERASITIR